MWACVRELLHARALLLPLGEHTPRHTDSAYFHPETMRLTGLTIAQPIFLQNIGGGKVVALGMGEWLYWEWGIDCTGSGGNGVLGVGEWLYWEWGGGCV